MSECKICKNEHNRSGLCSKCNSTKQLILDQAEMELIAPGSKIHKDYSWFFVMAQEAGYKIDFLYREPVDTDCKQCGKSFPRLGNSVTCITCRRMSKQWSVYSSRKDSYSASFWALADKYAARMLEGLEVPTNFMRWHNNLDAGTLDELYRRAERKRIQDEAIASVRDRRKSIRPKA